MSDASGLRLLQSTEERHDTGATSRSMQEVQRLAVSLQ
jgi:hypothetical protein